MESFLSKIAEYTMEPVGRQVGYIIHCKSNLRKLEDAAERLKVARESLAIEVNAVQRKGEKILPDVQLWLKKVDMIVTNADSLLKDASQAKLKCLNGFCPNPTIRRHLSRYSTKLATEIVELYEKQRFSTVSYGTLREEVLSVPSNDYLAFSSRMSVVKEIMEELRNSETTRIGVYGMGGVGKTTLVKQVYKQAAEDKGLFDDVIILLDVKQNPDLEAIQKKIAERLGMEILDNETIYGRGRRLYARIQGKVILVILDDVQETLDLEVVGLPHLPTCKILLTCRSREVLSSEMRVQKEFHLDVLDEEEAWSLFEKMAGDVVKQNGRVREIAKQVAEKCGGLPVLVITAARALKGKSRIHEWKDALRRLKRFDQNETSTDKAYMALEWSYSNLGDEELKTLFLLCGFVARENLICLSDLLKYCVGLRLFKYVDTVEEARDMLAVLLEKLKDSCLLLESDVDGFVKIHDLVCHVANRIAYRDQHVLSVAYRDELEDWPDKEFFKKCTMISLKSSHIPMLSQIPWECRELRVFHLVGEAISTNSVEIPYNFFEEMTALKVLHLTNLHMLSLPPSLQFLTNLHMLCLDKSILEDVGLIGQLRNIEILSFGQSRVKQLPKEIGQLTSLRLLDLSDCSELEVIPPGVISSLVRLQELRMRNSFNKWEVEGEGSNASLSELRHLSQLSSLEIHIPNADILPANLFSDFSLKLERFNIIIGDADVWEKLVAKTTLNTLKLQLTTSFEQLDEGLRFLVKRSEDLSLHGEGINNIVHQLDMEDIEHLKHLQLQSDVDFTDIINRKVVFPNLTILSVHGCNHLRFMFSFSMARSFVSLKKLVISTCELIEEIISSTTECEENMDMFSRLEDLILVGIPNLARFSRGSYIEFPSLKNLEIVQCSNMGAFIGDNKIWKEIEERDLKENLDVKRQSTAVQYFLFDGKAGFPGLERLKINQASKLKTIWHIQFAPDSFCRLRQVEVSECASLISVLPPSIMGRLNALEKLRIEDCKSLEVVFELDRGTTVKEPHFASPHDRLKVLYCQNLDSVRIYKCGSLKKIFPASVARGLHQLDQLSVESCSGVEEIVGEEEEEEEGVLETKPPHFVFPKVTSVQLEAIPLLNKFYPGMHDLHWPLLKELKATGYDKVEIRTSGLLFFQGKHELDPLTQRSLFLIDKGAFLNLEYLHLGAKEIWYGPSTAELFGELKSISFRDCSPFSKQASILFLQRLPNLEAIEVIGGPSEDLFVNEGNGSGSSGEIHDAVDSWTVPRVRELKLYGMDNLMHLGGGMRENSKSADANQPFPNLQILDMGWCSRLKNLESPVTFQNLTTLKVVGCKGLEYLTTYSVAKSLVQLRTMEVRSCERITVILASNIFGDNDPDVHHEIAFNRLQHLTLADLPRLQGFCSSRNCIVKFSSPITLTVEFCPIELQISPDGILLSQRTESRISTMKKIMDELKNPNTSRIGVCGIAGVGKTTLVKEVHKQATKDKWLFDDVVILLDVKSNTDFEGIQKKIVEKLGMDILDSDTIDGRASRLSARIMDKKILVILDDVWEQIDLVAVGLPSVAACKILLTSRSRKILSDMSTQKEFLLDILHEEESWVLFEEKAGDVVMDPAIQTVAKQVVKNCGGLPILVVTVASALKQRHTLPLWTDALTCLQKGEELTEKAYLGLEWSYNQLNDKELKPLFLLCGVNIRGNRISLADLLRYSMGLGFFEKGFTVEQARKALLARIEKLKDYCLLTDNGGNRYVGMHELVLHVANQIAFRDQHILSLVEEGSNRELKEWPDKYFLEKCKIMFLPCGNNIPRLPEIMHCPALTMFHLQGDLDEDSQKILPRFFEKMKNLQVLSLRCMTIPTLPSSLQFLKNLVFLCLDQCILGDIALIGELSNLEILSFSESNVKQLPRAVGQLTHLRLLDLSDCSELEVISPGVISSIGRLEELRMRNSFNKWEVEGEGSNASLSELKHLSQLSSLEIHIPNADILPANLFSNKLERFNIIIGDVCEKLMVETTLNSLKLKLTTGIEQLDEGLKFLVERSEDLSLYTESVKNIFHPHTQEFEHLKRLQLQSDVVDFTDIINRKVVFPNLTTLRVPRCDGLSFLFSFSMPENLVELQSLAELKHLDISTYEIMEESLSSIREYSRENMDNMFSKWINLKLNESPDIVRLCSGSIDKLEIEGWIKMMSGKNTRICKEIEESHSEENLDVKRELITEKYFLFDLKAVFPNLTSLTVHRCDRLSFLFSISMAKSLVELKHLEISTCAIIEEIVSSTRKHGQQNMDNMFPKLENLKLNELPNLTRFCSGSYIQLVSLENLDIEGCSKLSTFISDDVAMSGEDLRICKEIEEDSEQNLDVNSKQNTAQCFLFDEKIGLPNLTNLMVHRCDGLNFLLLSSMARSLVKLKHLVISECQKMEAVLTKEHSEENKDNMFPELKELELKDLPHLIRFCSGNYFKFASMERLQLEKCAKLETFICNPWSDSISSQKEMERVDKNENLETVVPYFLFDKKVGLPRLERLIINDLPKLTKIWHTQLAPNSFLELRDVTVQQCNGLKYIFQDSIIAGVFQQLQKLIVKECGVEEIVSQEEGVEKLMHDQFFPELACLEFTSLFQLKRFYPRMPAINWPLKTLVFSDCQKVDIFALELSGLQNTPDLGNKQYSVLYEKSSFPKLEHLTFGPVDIWYGRPAHEKALFPATSTDGSLPHLRTLRLHGMQKFMRLWENTEPAAGSAFPQIETLEVKFSGLTNLELSAISFRNLTTLEVAFCWRLQYLTTYSVAQSLVQLRTLKVDECKNMKEIFTSEGMGEDESECEIEFSQLQHLELTDLISLEQFCSSNCSVKVPALETLKVNWCPFKLKVSSDKVLEVDLDVQKAHSSKEAFDTTESACISETNQKWPAPNASKGAQHIEDDARELQDDSLITELNNNGLRLPGITGSEHVTNTSKNASEGKQLQLKQLDGVQTESGSQSLSMLEQDIRRLREELRAKEAEMRDRQQRQLATVDRLSDPS